MNLREYAKGLGLDALVLTGFNGVRAIVGPLIAGFVGATGQKLADKAADEVIAYLELSDVDEQMIDDALPLLTRTEQQAWHDLMATFEPAVVAPADPGYPEYQKAVKEAIKLKEYYRRLSCKANKFLTAAKMKRDAAKTPLEWEAYKTSLDIKHKALNTKYAPFFEWVKLHGNSTLSKVSAKVEANRVEANSKIGDAATGLRNWVDEFMADR